MDLASLTNTPGSRHRRKRVGRGTASGHGRQSGKGHKGQFARKGHKLKPGFEGGQMPLLRRLPKRGFKNPGRVAASGVNVGDLDRFPDGAAVGPEQLAAAGLVDARARRIKILAGGACTKKLAVKAHAFSAAARARIEAAGGACEVMP